MAKKCLRNCSERKCISDQTWSLSSPPLEAPAVVGVVVDTVRVFLISEIMTCRPRKTRKILVQTEKGHTKKLQTQDKVQKSKYIG